MKKQGLFYGIGVGPGDPELMTVKAINAIKNSDVIIGQKTALHIAKPYLPPDAQVVLQTYPMAKDFDKSPDTLENNVKEILSHLNKGKNVGFLTLGDPMFYSTYIYVFKLLKVAGIKIETVPGVTAFSAVAAKTGYPVACGDEILTIVPATADPDKISDALKSCDDAVLMKVYKNFHEVAKLLKDEKLAENAVLVSRCGLDDEKAVTDITTCKDEDINYLSTILTRRKI